VADTGKLTFEDEAIAIAKEITILFEKGVNFIIALGNAGYDRGQTLLNTSLNVDLIVNGGGTSVFQYTGKNKINQFECLD
jgi:2',3'-cyclic-nucleotide 2'-phosphodiesterase (5'-nucleotidase family)